MNIAFLGAALNHSLLRSSWYAGFVLSAYLDSNYSIGPADTRTHDAPTTGVRKLALPCFASRNEKIMLNLTRDELLEAMALFDGGRRSPQWALRNRAATTVYVVQYRERRYPIRELARLALHTRDGQWEQESVGSAELRAHVQNLGFSVIPLRRPGPDARPPGPPSQRT